MCAAVKQNKQSSIGIVVFASGRGSNFRALCEASQSGRLSARIEALVTNTSDAPVVGIAREFGIPLLEHSHRGLSREAHEELVLKSLDAFSFDWIVLAGYMRLFSKKFIRRFWDQDLNTARIVNIHPSLLPSFPGTDGYGQAIRYGVKVTGVTVHLVSEGLDDGPIVGQAALDVREDDTEETLSARGRLLEHQIYVESLEKLLTKPWRVSSPQAGSHPEGRGRVVFEGARA